MSCETKNQEKPGRVDIHLTGRMEKHLLQFTYG